MGAPASATTDPQSATAPPPSRCRPIPAGRTGYELRRRTADGGPLAVAAHPDGADTTGSKRAMSHSSALTRLAFAAVRPLLLQSPALGALPVLRAATDPEVRGGEYYRPRGFQQSKGHPTTVRSGPSSQDAALQRRLWILSGELTGVTFPL
ncbi:hypothetical protein [Streptomyces sp. MC1]|uniref:hypothetical protein n=1 Tax=Streptomyces sp. MC1 TaxID=295105 RepID=UPI001E3611AF|nr:hypothetical protein [Streptomyces sp. MC1]